MSRGRGAILGLVAAVLGAAAVLGCGGGSSDDVTGTTVMLRDADNYQFNGSLAIRPYPLQELSDPLIDWSGLTHDLQGHALDPATDLDYSALVVIANLTESEIEAALSSNSLAQAYIVAYVSVAIQGRTSVHMDEYTVFGNDIDIETDFTSGYGVWLLVLGTGTTPGTGVRMAAFLEPDASSSATSVALADDSTQLDFTVDLHSLHRVRVPAALSGYSLDWSGLTLKADGSELDASDIDQVLVAHYASLTVADLEDQFLDIELIADDMWSVAVASGTGASLDDLAGASAAFTGIDDQGVWLLALRCTTCANPAPPFITILEPAG